ncbi:replication region DNA-binding N-term [Cedecea sp. NFIX57]|nr:DNA-binding protein [Cedecea sp. NFIX57]SMG61851.1 replication region DNA-binding N-term [Cedecea sp. NFIX57]
MSKLPSPDMVRRIEDAAAALIAAGTPNPTNTQVRDHLGGGSLATISPVMRAFRARLREQESDEAPALPAELAQLLTGQLTLLWQTAVKQAEAGARDAREQADADIEQADLERDTAQARVAELETELAVLREVQAERDRLLQQALGLQERMISLREEVVRQQTNNEHLATQLKESREEVNTLRAGEKALQAELLALARGEGKVKK